MVEQALSQIVILLCIALIGITIIAVALIIALAIILCKINNTSLLDG